MLYLHAKFPASSPTRTGIAHVPLVVHSNSKRYIKLSIFFPFHIEEQIKLEQYGEKVHWYKIIGLSLRECKNLHCKESSYWWPGVNSLAPGRFEQNFRKVIFQLMSVTDGWGISSIMALRWMWLDLTDEKSTLVQVMAWCRQATSHYLSRCWPRFMSPYGVIRPQ